MSQIYAFHFHMKHSFRNRELLSFIFVDSVQCMSTIKGSLLPEFRAEMIIKDMNRFVSFILRFDRCFFCYDEKMFHGISYVDWNGFVSRKKYLRWNNFWYRNLYSIHAFMRSSNIYQSIDLFFFYSTSLHSYIWVFVWKNVK